MQPMLACLRATQLSFGSESEAQNYKLYLGCGDLKNKWPIFHTTGFRGGEEKRREENRKERERENRIIISWNWDWGMELRRLRLAWITAAAASSFWERASSPATCPSHSCNKAGTYRPYMHCLSLSFSLL